MKTIKFLITGILAIFIMSSCIDCRETKKKYNEALSYTTLTPLTVDKMDSLIKNSTKDFKIMYVYNICGPHKPYIVNTLQKFKASHPTDNVDYFVINHNCGYLKGIEPFFAKNNLDFTRYYYRDNSKDFGNRFDDTLEKRKAMRYFVNGDKLDNVLHNGVCYVANKENILKLARYTCETKQGKKEVILPCPLEQFDMPIENEDFNSIKEIPVKADNDDTIYLIYFSEFDK